MKKITTIALTGALALGALAGVTAFDAKPAAAASVQTASSMSNWDDPKTIMDIATLADDMPTSMTQTIQSNYKTGENFFTKFFATDELMQAQSPVKIYRIMDDKTVVRYQTIYPFQANGPTTDYAVWQTRITSGYDAGNYIAVVNLYGNLYKSQWFTINK